MSIFSTCKPFKRLLILIKCTIGSVYWGKDAVIYTYMGFRKNAVIRSVDRETLYLSNQA